MAIIVGSVSVDVIPSVRDFSKNVRAKLIPQADKMGRELGQHLARNIKDVLDAELRNLPKAHIELDTAEVETGVAKVRRELGDLGRDTAKPNVGLSTKDFDTGAAQVKFMLRDIGATKTEPKIKPTIDTSSLNILRAKLEDVSRRAYSPDIKIVDREAQIAILRIKARLAELDKVTSRPNIDLAGFIRAQAEIEQLNLELDEFGRKHVTAKADINTDSGARGIRRLLDLAIGLAPALTTVGVVGVGVGAGLAASFATAASGLGLFAVAAQSSFALIKQDTKTLTKDNKTLAEAQKAVDNAKGPKARATAMQKLHDAQKAVQADLKAMPPAERKVAADAEAMKNTWHDWLRGVAIPGLASLTGPLRKNLPALLRDITPLFKGTVAGLRDFERAAFKAFASPFWQRFFRFLGREARPTIAGLGRVLLNTAKGIAGLIQGLSPLTHRFEGDVLRISQRFANFGAKAAAGKSGGFNSFIAYVKQNGPAVASALKSIGRFLGEFGGALAKIGPGELRAIAGFLDVVTKFAKAHPALFEAAVAMLVFSKAVSALRIASLGGGLIRMLNLLLKLKGGGGIGGIAGDLAGAGGGGGIASKLFGEGGKLSSVGAGAGRLGSLAFDAAGGAAGLAGGATLVGIPLLLSYLNSHFVQQGSHLLEQRGSHQVKTPGGGSVSVPNLPHPARGGGGAGGRQRAADAAASQYTAPPNLGVSGQGAFSIPVPIFAHPHSPLEKHGNKVTLPKANIYIPPADLGVQYTKGQRKTIDAAKRLGQDVAGALGSFFGQGAGVSGPPSIPVAITTKGANKAALDLINVGRAAKHLPLVKSIKVAGPGAKNTAIEIENVNRAQRHLPPEKRLKVSAPGGNLSALTLVNVGRAAKGLPPLKHINVSTPGAKGARADIDKLAHQSGLLPPNKHINTSAPGAKKAILDMINLDRKAHGLPPLKRIPTSAPGADKATQALIVLARRAGLLPSVKHIKTDTPGAVTAKGQLEHLLHAAGVLPKGKHIPTDVPGASDAILKMINLKRRADGLPPLKKIPTSAPGGDHSIQQMIDLARRIGLVPKKHDTQVNTPGSKAAHAAIQGIKDVLGSIKPSYSVALKVIGSASDAFKSFHFAHGGEVDGPPGTDVVPAMLTAHEYVQPKHVVQREGVPAMDALRAGRAMIIPKPRGYASGGLVVNTQSSGLAPIKSGVPHFLASATAKIGADLTKAIQNAFGSLAGSAGGGAGAWLGVVKEALALLHQPIGLAGLFLRVIAGESGGNPRAINLYDRNARNGTPSVGLAQVIGPTFAAWAGPFRNVGPFMAGVSVNPLANVYAGLNYGIHTYGSVAGIPGIASELHGGGYRPYARGGFAYGGVPIQVGERGTEIFTPASDGYITPHNELGGGVAIRVFIGNEEIRNIARVEVDRNAAVAGRSIAAGRRIVR